MTTGDQFARRAWERHERTHLQFLTASLDSAREALKALLVVNGGASVALLAFLAAATRIEDLTRQAVFAALATKALRWFAFGTLAAVMACGLAYLTAAFAASAISTRLASNDPPYFEETPESLRYKAMATGVNIGAVIAGIASLGFFLTGILKIGSIF
jgi:ABC-type multidrug transport system fused ATPase/permease subunit